MKRVLVKGPALSASGYGEQCRFALRALKTQEERFDIYLQDINWGQTGQISFDSEERAWLDHLLGKTVSYVQQGGQFDISLQVTIPNEWDTTLAPYNIGYTAGIETTKIAPQWIEPSNRMDKIIVVSNHAKYGFENTVYRGKNEQTGEESDFRVTTPVEVVNYPVRDTKAVDLNLDFETDFNFLSVCQWGPRKNLEATVVCFIEEFGENENVGLVLKTSIARNNEMDRQACRRRLEALLTNFPNKKCKIYLLHGNLSSDEMASLYTHPKIKAMISTTHGEGYGLPMFEAAYKGLPIIAPNWSGHVDFLYAPVKDKKKNKIKQRPHFVKIDYELKNVQRAAVWDGVVAADSKWCFVKKQSVKDGLKEAFKNNEKRQIIARRLQKFIVEKFNKEDIYEQFVNEIHEADDEWENELDEITEI